MKTETKNSTTNEFDRLSKLVDIAKKIESMPNIPLRPGQVFQANATKALSNPLESKIQTGVEVSYGLKPRL